MWLCSSAKGAALCDHFSRLCRIRVSEKSGKCLGLLCRNVLRIVRGNPSLVAGVQRRTSNLGPRPAGQETPTSAPAQKLPGGPSIPLPPHLENNGRLAIPQSPPWLASGVEQAPSGGPEQATAAGPKQAALPAADGAVLHASGTTPTLPPAQDRAQIAQNGLKAASTHQSERSSSPDSSSRSSSPSSDSSSSRSSASDSSSRCTSCLKLLFCHLTVTAGAVHSVEGAALPYNPVLF